MAGAESVITRIDAAEQNLSRPTSVISVTLYTTPGRHADEGAVRAAIAAALDRRFPGVDAVRVALEHEPAGSRPRRGRAN
jgi:hypothetical protein